MSDRTPEERRWAMSIENATFGVWDLDPRLELVHYSPQWKARLGFPRIDAPDSSAFWRCRVHPDDFDPMLGSLRSHLDGRTSTYDMRFRLRSNGSGYRSMLSRGRVVARDELGNATRMIGTMVDLTGRASAAANYGLATELPVQTGALHRLPFHAVLGGAPERDGLVELIDDLLDVAWRDARAAL
jgi:PAS domain-containing protein